jgi:hypothetical protein
MVVVLPVDSFFVGLTTGDGLSFSGAGGPSWEVAPLPDEDAARREAAPGAEPDLDPRPEPD